MARRAGVLVLAGLLGLLVACDDGDEVTTTGTTDAPNADDDDDEDDGATGVTHGLGDCGDFLGGETEAVTAEAEGGPLFIADVTHRVTETGDHDPRFAPPPCVEDVTFTFEPAAAAASVGYEVAYEDGPFEDVSGRAAEVEGSDFIRVVLLNATTVDLSSEEPRETFAGEVEITGDFSDVVDIVKVSDFEAVTEWVIGLEGVHPFEVATAEGDDGAIVLTIRVRPTPPI